MTPLDPGEHFHAFTMSKHRYDLKSRITYLLSCHVLQVKGIRHDVLDLQFSGCYFSYSFLAKEYTALGVVLAHLPYSLRDAVMVT